MLPGLWRHPPVTSRPSIGQITQQIQSRSRTRRSQSVVTQRLVPSRNHGYIRNLETFSLWKCLAFSQPFEIKTNARNWLKRYNDVCIAIKPSYWRNVGTGFPVNMMLYSRYSILHLLWYFHIQTQLNDSIHSCQQFAWCILLIKRMTLKTTGITYRGKIMEIFFNQTIIQNHNHCEIMQTSKTDITSFQVS